MTLEFLSTLKHTVPNHPGSTEEGVDRVTFQLMDRSYDISFNEWCHHFRFLNSDDRLRSVHQGLTPSPRSYFHQMSKYSGTPKGGQIESPAIHYLYYVIASTLQARGEFTKVNEEEMIILAKAAIPTCKLGVTLQVGIEALARMIISSSLTLVNSPRACKVLAIHSTNSE